MKAKRGDAAEAAPAEAPAALAETVARQVAQLTPEERQKVLKGSSKYNLKYFLKPTEIFARCGELYVKEVRGVEKPPEAGGAVLADIEAFGRRLWQD